jgi:superfamily II DNA or RNA helicase
MVDEGEVMEHFLTHHRPKITNAMSAFEFSHGLAAKYKFLSAYNEEVDGAIRKGSTLWVPRESVPYAEPAQDFRSVHHLGAIECKFQPRHEQGLLVEKSLELLKQGRNHIFQAPTGWGKTVVGGAIACALGQTTLIVVTKQDLMDQWRRSLTQILGVPTNQIGMLQADVEDWKEKRFVLGMVQSLMIEDKYPEEVFKYFGLLILDEVHMMAAECFVRVCQTVYAKYRLGFSATPERKDGKTKLLSWHIGPVLVKGLVPSMKPKVLVRQTGWCIPYQRRLIGHTWQQVPIPHAPGRMTLVTKAMAQSEGRNMEVVNFVVQAYDAGRRVLVLSDLKVNHLTRLFQMLASAGIPGQDIGYYVGGMTKQELTSTKTRRVVLGTYQMCATGTDVPEWSTLVMATPRADIRQAVGRVLRYLDGKVQPVILDLVDRDAIFQNFHLSRVKQYYGIGATVVKVQ